MHYLRSMDKQDTQYLKESLRNQRPHERFNEALSRTICDKIKNKKGYELYIRLIGRVREVAKEKKLSETEAVKLILGRS